ncbi:FmdB family zinc ribbon protein [Alicyclobacillus cellulosilyticus]|uniref:FmdB family zinc ribbon protein n=1 Tax=Alicyclobacillus cellulosilyticus TaxID=1003997 RepID=UPI0016687539|nr:FmdB family zinc ribbon protein [Alicyclobacillus cellulosilyticus]
MPVYEFWCERCGEFAKQMPMREASSTATCPSCGQSATRIFSNIAICAVSGAVRRKEEQGEVPKVMTRDEWRAQTAHEHRHRHPARPWQLGH